MKNNILEKMMKNICKYYNKNKGETKKIIDNYEKAEKNKKVDNKK